VYVLFSISAHLRMEVVTRFRYSNSAHLGMEVCKEHIRNTLGTR